jgi:hypothetical protein
MQTPKPAAAPAANDPHALTASNVKASILNNQEQGANFDNLNVSIQQGTIAVVVAKPNTVIDEQDTITKDAEDTLSVVKSVKGWYPTLTAIHVQVDGDFTDAQGNSSTESAAWIEMSSDTLNGINPDGLWSRAFDTPSIVFTDGDAYDIHPAIFKNIKSADQNALGGQSSSGTSVLDTIPS